jgi:hypothetical protein
MQRETKKEQDSFTSEVRKIHILFRNAQLSTSLVQKDPKNAYFQIKVLALII